MSSVQICRTVGKVKREAVFVISDRAAVVGHVRKQLEQSPRSGIRTGRTCHLPRYHYMVVSSESHMETEKPDFIAKVVSDVL
jgi:hypothetical protein